MTPEWLLSKEPRQVQEEAIRRSWYGVKQLDRHDGVGVATPMHGRNGDPAVGWAHFLEMRLGKTPVALNELALSKKYLKVKWGLVISPNSYKPTWVKEAEEFDAPFDSMVLDSGKLKKLQEFKRKNKSGGMIVTNYEALRSKNVMEALQDLYDDPVSVIADESVLIKGHDSIISKMTRALTKDAAIKRILTGKPVVQGAQDLWSQLRAIDQINGMNYFAFKAAFCRTGGFMGKQIIGVKNEERLQTILNGCSFSARKIEWLPSYLGKDYAEPRNIEMTPEQRDAYVFMEKECFLALDTGEVISPDMVITKLQKLQQISSGYIKLEDGGIKELIAPSRNPKLNALKDMLENELTGKLIVMCDSNYALDLLMRELIEYNPAVIRGLMWHTKNGVSIDHQKDKFNTDPTCRVMIGQEKAIKYGHTLMGSKEHPCLDVVFFENSGSLDDRSQCEERPQGAYQMGMITIHDFACSPLEFRVVKALQKKEDVSSTVMGYARATGVLPRSP